MGLLFTPSGARVNHGSAAELDNLDPFTLIFVHQPLTLDTTFKMLWAKSGNFFSCDNESGFGGTGSLRIRLPHATTNMDYHTASNVVAANVTYLTAVVVDLGLGAGNRAKFYNAEYGAEMVQAVAAATDTEPVGSRTSDASADMMIGAFGASGTLNHDGEIYRAAVFDQALTQAQINRLMHASLADWAAFAPVMLVDYYGTGTQPDLSGSGNNGTVSAATAADHAPIPPVFGWGGEPVLVTAAADVEVSATTDALTLTEQAATISYDVTVSAGTDALTLTEQAASVSYDVTISAGVDALALTENAATVSYDVTVSAGTDALTLSEQAASVSLGVDVSATTDALTLTEHSASIIADTLVNATTATLTLSEQAATVALDVTVSAGTDALTLSEQTASVSYDVTVSAATDALSLATLAASISAGVAVATLFPPHITTVEPRTWRVTTDRTWRTDSDRTWRTNG